MLDDDSLTVPESHTDPLALLRAELVGALDDLTWSRSAVTGSLAVQDRLDLVVDLTCDRLAAVLDALGEPARPVQPVP